MNEYRIRYRGAYVGIDGWITASWDVREFRCFSKSKVEALMRLVNLEAVHQVLSVERIKE